MWQTPELYHSVIYTQVWLMSISIQRGIICLCWDTNCPPKYLTPGSDILFVFVRVFMSLHFLCYLFISLFFNLFSVCSHFSCSLGYLDAFAGWTSSVLMYFNSPIFFSAFTSSMRRVTVSSNWKGCISTWEGNWHLWEKSFIKNFSIIAEMWAAKSWVSPALFHFLI